MCVHSPRARDRVGILIQMSDNSAICVTKNSSGPASSQQMHNQFYLFVSCFLLLLSLLDTVRVRSSHSAPGFSVALSGAPGIECRPCQGGSSRCLEMNPRRWLLLLLLLLCSVILSNQHVAHVAASPFLRAALRN